VTLDEAVSIQQNSVDEASNRLKSKAIQSQCRVYHLCLTEFVMSSEVIWVRCPDTGGIGPPFLLAKILSKMLEIIGSCELPSPRWANVFRPRPTSLKTAVAWTLRARTFWNGMGRPLEWNVNGQRCVRACGPFSVI
jgi:hypothetical protein